MGVNFGDSNQHWDGCECPQCEERRALRKRAEEFEQHEQETHEMLGAILGTDDALHVLASRLKARAEKAELEFGRAIPIWEEALKLARDRAEKAERERDAQAEYIAGCDAAMEGLQADLDVALDWIEHDEEESIPPPGLYQHIKALLENRRQKRG